MDVLEDCSDLQRQLTREGYAVRKQVLRPPEISGFAELLRRHNWRSAQVAGEQLYLVPDPEPRASGSALTYLSMEIAAIYPGFQFHHRRFRRYPAARYADPWRIESRYVAGVLVIEGAASTMIIGDTRNARAAIAAGDLLLLAAKDSGGIGNEPAHLAFSKVQEELTILCLSYRP